MKFKLIKYLPEETVFLSKDENGISIKLDLTTDSSFPQISDTPEYLAICNGDGNETYDEFMKKIEGRTIECERIFPYTPMYFVANGKFIDKP